MNENSDSQAYVNIAAEQSVLGALMLDSSKIDDVREIVTSEDFRVIRHHSIFRAICELCDSRQPTDPVTVADRIAAQGEEPDLGYLDEMFRTTASAANAVSYARIVAECSTKRAVSMAGAEIAGYPHKYPGYSAADALDFAQARIMELGNMGKSSAEATDMNRALLDYVDHLDYLHNQGDAIDGLATGLTDLDRRVNGYKPDNLVIVAGRPSQGKTTLALCMATHFSVRLKKRGLFFSLEMGKNELMEKVTAGVGRIPLNDLKKPAAASGELWPKISAAVAQCKDAPMGIVDCPGIHLNALKSFVRKAHRRQPLDYIMVDHIHLMEADGERNVDKFGAISRGLKQLAKELHIPVFALAQLSRKLEERTNKRPMMSDLRESGRIEEDADIIHFVYRDEYYNPQTNNPGIMELITSKFRNGEVGADYLAAQLHISRVDDLAPGSYTPMEVKTGTRNMREGML